MQFKSHSNELIHSCMYCSLSPQKMQSDPTSLRRTIMDIIRNPFKSLTGPNKAKILTKSYRYVNSDNRLLMKVSRRVVKNMELFGVPMPTIAQQMEYVSTELKQCQTSLSRATNKNILTKIEEFFEATLG